ncbi:MAG: hypothetical protein COB20_12165 [SAR86 cluster bacterium]|uniref:Uncharacterized protein n=1 Tax=SAR86 cluster bacterium TaxID=2030880 RepID=A0A2A4WZJ4_9GAMM|nr:MAG: hypothetical protein COB20_12165 [SAR86 cluster bacterium]
MLKIIRNSVAAAMLVILTACAGGNTNPFAGSWDTVATTPVGNQDSVWTISEDGTGIMSGDAGEQAIDGIVVDGNNVSFDVVIDAGGQSLSLSFSGVVEGDSLTGAFGSDFGDFNVTGTRQ